LGPELAELRLEAGMLGDVHVGGEVELLDHLYRVCLLWKQNVEWRMENVEMARDRGWESGTDIQEIRKRDPFAAAR